MHIHFVLAKTLNQAGLAEESAAEFRTAIEGYRGQVGLNPIDAVGLYYLARAMTDCPTLENPEREEAVTLASRAVEFRPTDRFFWLVLGRARYRVADFRGALDALLKAREFGDGEASTFFLLAMAEAHLGNADSAQEWFAKGAAWMEEHPQVEGGDIVAFRAEAEQLLGVFKTAVQESNTTSAQRAKDSG